MKKLLLPALCAFAVSAHAADWFDAGIAGYDSWPSDGSDKVVANQGTWTGTSGTTLENHVLNVNAPAETTLAFTPTGSVDVAAVQVAFESTNTLTSVQDISALAPLEQWVKGAIAVAADGATTNFYGWAQDPAGATNVWRVLSLSGAMPAVGTPFAVRILAKSANGDFYVQYEVGGVALTAGADSWLPVAVQDTTLGHAGMRGGDLAVAALSGTTEAYPAAMVTLTIPALSEGVTLVSVTADGIPVEAVEGVYTVADGATVVATFAPAPGYLLVGDATVTVVMDGDTTLSGLPTAAAIPLYELTIPALPEGVTLVSVTTNDVAIAAVGGIYSVYSNDTVVATFAPAAGYRLVGDATVSVTMVGNTTLSGIPTAEAIPLYNLTIPALSEGVTLVSVTTNGVAVAGVENAYTVYSNATVVATFAAAAGYELVGSATATVTVDGDTELSAASIPAAVSVNSLVKINEIMASNPSLDKGGITNALGIGEMDWVEFYNGSSQAINLAGWFLSDNDKKGKETKATILGSCVIPAGGYKIVWLDKIHVDPSEYGPDEAFAVLKLSSSGDLIQLADSGTNVIDKVDFKTKPQIKGYSYGPLAVESNGVLVPGNGDPVYMKTATPEAPNVTEGWGDFTPAVTFSEPHGYKTEAFSLTLSCADTNATIYYTLDGSSPTTASILYTNAIPISKTTVVRAAVPDPTSVLQFDTSATYIFLDDVLAQEQSKYAPESAVGFPDSGTVKSHKMLYGMRQEIVTGADRDRLLRGFTNSIATISLVIDPANLFNSSTGIYVNPAGRGEEWERQTMLEQINPLDPADGFSIPAGLRIRGSNSRTASRPKHALRLFFRSSYGMSSLEHKMFPGEPDKEAGEYDKIDLRCSQNSSWAGENSNADTFVHEVFSRDSQRDMGQFHTRSRYYNLFINGQYWGLYQSQERGDEHFAESYAGGDSLDWDVIKTTTRVNETTHETEKYVLEADEGTLDAWSNLWETVVVNPAGLSSDAIYQRVLGNNPDGTRNAAYPELLNPTNLMAYVLLTHYVVDGDGPVTPNGQGGPHLNNMYALYDRTDGPTSVHGFFHLRHDAEMSFGKRGNVGYKADPTGWGSGDPSTIGGINLYSDFWNTLEGFSPVKLHWELEKSAAYRRACADQFDKFFLRPGGAMTTEKNIERFAKRMAEIDDAIVCEAARWGKGPDGTGSGYSRDTWLTACRNCTNGFLAVRMPYMLSQYRARGWYPSLDTPRVVNGSGVIYAEGGEVPYLEKVYLTGDAEGTTYYTLDGTDPMEAGATVYGGNGFAIPDEGATIRARTLKNGEWSALEEVTLESDVPNDQRYGIRVAAILNAAVNDPADEFIVLTNTLDRAVDLYGLSIWSEKAGKALTKLAEFTESTNLPAGGTVTLTQPANWIGDAKLKNGGIFVELHDFNGKRIQNTYVDSESWFWTGEYDEKGKKVCLCNKTGRWFVALEFLGDTDPGEVTLETQWTVNPLAPAIPLPEDATTQAAVLDLMEYDDRIEPWFAEIAATEAGYTAITNFTGSTNALVTCYLVNILPDSNPEIELTMPSITFDEDGNPVVEGELLNHGTEVETTVRGYLRLYYADTLEDLETTTDFIQLTPPTLPVEATNDVSGVTIPDARFYRLKIE